MKIKYGFIVLLGLITTPIFGFQQQGFSDFQENKNEITSFSCTNQCFILVGPKGSNDNINIYGKFNGNGIIGYGFLINNQIIPGEISEVQGEKTIKNSFLFNKIQGYDQIPQDSQIIVIVQGNIQGKSIQIASTSLTLGDKIIEGRKDFWANEPMTPYSINLRYGVKILGTSILTYGYRIFIVTAIYLFFFSKDKKYHVYKKIAFTGLGIFLFIGIRNMITNTDIVLKNIKTFGEENKVIFDLGDYMGFTNKIRETLQLDLNKNQRCNIKVYSFQERPFSAHWENLYLKPCTVVKTGSLADYTIYYHTAITGTDINKQVLLQYNDNYLLKNK